jgi:RNA polymerase sigma factor (sigma-70 family)
MTAGKPGSAHVVDEAMFERVHRQESERLVNYLAKRVGREAAPEVSAQTWLEFFAWWPAHPDHPSPTGTLYIIAQRRAADQLRRSGRTLPVEGSDLEALAAGLRPGDGGVATAELRLDLEQALEELSAQHRRALELHYLDELPVARCAELMGLGVNNMKKILKTALRTLRHSPGMAVYRTVTTAEEARG